MGQQRLRTRPPPEIFPQDADPTGPSATDASAAWLKPEACLGAGRLQKRGTRARGEPYGKGAGRRAHPGPGDVAAGIDIKDNGAADAKGPDARARQMVFTPAGLHQREQALDVLDGDDL